MTLINQKSCYALQAVFELARHFGGDPLASGDIAKAQGIPRRFLEVILRDLKQAGVVRSKRGAAGGYQLVRPPERITVGAIIRVFQGPIETMACMEICLGKVQGCRGCTDCAFHPLWTHLQDAITEIYEGTNFDELVRRQPQGEQEYVPNYMI